MDFFGGIERFISADLYPYRWAVTAALIAGVVALLLVAYRLGWHRVLWRHKLVTAAVALPALAVLIPAAWYLVSPLWERSYLEEASPMAAAALATPSAVSEAAGAPPAGPTPQQFPRETHMGAFMGADDFHFGRGKAQLIETGPGVYTLRFEDFSVRNGPDLYVYLTPDPSGESIEGAVNLGGLKATDGAFNYELPPGTDITQFASAIVWCRQFATLFAVAELSPT